VPHHPCHRQLSSATRERSERGVERERGYQRKKEMDVEKVERKEVEVDDDGRVRTGTTHTVWAL
jgi:hypothetical protein